MDLRSFQSLFFVWGWEQRNLYSNKDALQQLIPVDLFPTHRNNFLKDSTKAFIFFSSGNIVLPFKYNIRKVLLWLTGLFLADFTPDCIVENFLTAAPTSQKQERNFWKKYIYISIHETTLNYLHELTQTLFLFPACVRKASFPCKLLTGFVLRVATSPGDKNTAPALTPSHIH